MHKQARNTKDDLLIQFLARNGTACPPMSHIGIRFSGHVVPVVGSRRNKCRLMPAQHQANSAKQFSRSRHRPLESTR